MWCSWIQFNHKSVIHLYFTKSFFCCFHFKLHETLASSFENQVAFYNNFDVNNIINNWLVTCHILRCYILPNSYDCMGASMLAVVFKQACLKTTAQSKCSHFDWAVVKYLLLELHNSGCFGKYTVVTRSQPFFSDDTVMIMCLAHQWKQTATYSKTIITISPKQYCQH